jgi:hypothetical protein
VEFQRDKIFKEPGDSQPPHTVYHDVAHIVNSIIYATDGSAFRHKCSVIAYRIVDLLQSRHSLDRRKGDSEGVFCGGAHGSWIA